MNVSINPSQFQLARTTPVVRAADAPKGAVPAASASTAPLKVEESIAQDNLFSPLMSGLRAWARGVPQAIADASRSAAVDEGATPDYSGSFELMVKTREGDTVKIRFSETRAGSTEDGKRIAASYEVEGNISDEERQALDKVITKVTEIADTFFDGVVGFGHLAVMDNLDFFDAGQLASFALDISQDRRFHQGGGQAERMYSSLSFDYTVDLKAKTQRLESELVLGYQQKEGAGQQRFGYDLETAIAPASKQLLAGMDVRALGRPGLYQSAPTALPSYYQGALQALSGNIDRLAELVEETDAQAAPIVDEEAIARLFRGIAENHPAYKAASDKARQGLGRMFDLLPDLIRQAPALNANLLDGTLRVKA